MEIKTKEVKTADGRWRLLTAIDEDNGVSTVRMGEAPIFQAANMLASFAEPAVMHGQPFETLTRLDGEWGVPIGNSTQEEARQTHEEEVAKLLKAKKLIQ